MSSPAHPASIGSGGVSGSSYQAASDNPAAVGVSGSREEVEAAIKIQKVVRGHLSRRNSEKVLGFSPRNSNPASPRASVSAAATEAAEPPKLAAEGTEANSNGAVEAEPRK